MDNTFKKILNVALEKIGAIFINNDVCNFKDPTSVEYQIGIQQEMNHKRFLNLFWEAECGSMIYFKHNPEKIQKLYQLYPEYIMPSEIASKHWSKVSIEDAMPEEIIQDLIDESYKLVLHSLPKKGQALIKAISHSENCFRLFHEIALELTEFEDVYISYHQGYIMPSIIYRSSKIADFQFNKLFIVFPKNLTENLLLPFEEIREVDHLHNLISISDNEKQHWRNILIQTLNNYKSGSARYKHT